MGTGFWTEHRLQGAGALLDQRRGERVDEGRKHKHINTAQVPPGEAGFAETVDLPNN